MNFVRDHKKSFSDKLKAQLSVLFNDYYSHCTWKRKTVLLHFDDDCTYRKISVLVKDLCLVYT